MHKFYKLFLSLRDKYMHDPETENSPAFFRDFYRIISDQVSRILGMQPQPPLRAVSSPKNTITPENLFKLHAGVLVLIKVRVFLRS